jgi:hypothetical protein
MDDNTIRIKLIEHGETFVDVERPRVRGSESQRRA